MDTKILIAIGTMIEDYALNAFVENGATGDEAAMIMEIAAARFLKQAHRDTIMSMVHKPGTENEAKTDAAEGIPESSAKTKETGEKAGETNNKEKLAMLKEFARTTADREDMEGKAAKDEEIVNADSQTED